MQQNQLAGKVAEVKRYWKTPPKGRYMNFREIAAYSVGGIGIYCVITVVNSMILAVGNTLIGNTIGIDPTSLYAIYVIATLAGIPLTALRAHIVDNTRGKNGKYRPYIITMGIPCVILSTAFVWMPYAGMTMTMKCVVVLAFNIAFQFFFNFFRDSYENLVYVLSPNSQERTDVAAIKSVVYSLAPSIIQPVMPLFAKLICNGDMTDIRLYRFVYPPIAVIGMMVGLIVYANTREKIIQAKTHVIQIKFIDALKAVAKNKYFWIISMAGWIGFLEGSYAQILYWLYQYGKACTASQYALITLLNGNAALWGMVFAPFLIKKYGKRKVLIATNVLNILFISLMYPFIDSIWLILCCTYMNGIVGAFSRILDPSIQADIRDYQQYVTGERIDGMFAAVLTIGSVITLATSGILPLIYKTVGNIDASNGLANPYDVLYDHAIYVKLIHALILFSVIGATLNLIPYFFYDLKETKQRGIVQVLRVRALFEDYGNNALSNEDLVQAIDIVNESEQCIAVGVLPLSKDGIQAAKRRKKAEGRKEAVKNAKKEYRRVIEHNKMVEISRFVVEEMHKFEQPYVQDQVTLARETVSAGLEGLSRVDPTILAKAKALPKGTDEEKKIRREAISLARKRLTSQRLVEKHYPSGIQPFDMTIFDELFRQEDELEVALDAAYKAYYAAKDNKDAAARAKAKEDIRRVKAQRSQIRKKLKAATDENSLYNRAAKPYIDARNLLMQEENFKHYDEIAVRYEQAKALAAETAAHKQMEEEEKATLKKERKEAAKSERKK